jgi:N-methylhydantoinase A
VIDLLTQNMVSAIEEITVQQGIDPKESVLVADGGAAGFNSIQIGRRLGCAAVLFPDTGARARWRTRSIEPVDPV